MRKLALWMVAAFGALIIGCVDEPDSTTVVVDDNDPPASHTTVIEDNTAAPTPDTNIDVDVTT